MGQALLLPPMALKKKRALKVLKIINAERLAVIGDKTAELDEVCISATAFQCVCYGKNTMKLVKV